MDPRIAASTVGLAATLPMTAVMIALHRLLPGEPDEPLPPRQITETAAGLGYLPFAGRSGMPPAVEGALFGLAVWGGSDLGLMPATGLYRPATEEPAARNALMITSHLVWGAALGVVFDRLTRQSSDR